MKTIKKVGICIHFTDGTKEESIGTFEEVQDFMYGAEVAHYTNPEEGIVGWWETLSAEECDSLAKAFYPGQDWFDLDDDQVAYLHSQETNIPTPSNITLQGAAKVAEGIYQAMMGRPSSIALQGAYKSKMDIDTKESQWTGGPSTGTSKHGPQI